MPKRRRSFPLPRFTVPTPVALIAACIIGLAHIGVELYKDFCPVIPAPKQMQVCFTPSKSCQNLILQQINSAFRTLHIQAFSFTDPEIGQALLKAKNRGVVIKVLLDQSNRTNKKSLAPLLSRQHIPIRIDAPGGIAHNKIMVVDGHTVITGSYNFSRGAYLRNTENVIILNDQALATFYLKNWKERWEKSSSFK